jgi:hypothetical protein
MLSPHFSLEEMVASDYAARHGIDNEPSALVIVNLSALCADVLEPLRAILGPIRVTSGYRSAELNPLVGGAVNSDHMLGLAADIVAPPRSIDELGAVVRSQLRLPIKQCIREFGAWIHISRIPLTDESDETIAQFLIASRSERGTVDYVRWEAA